MNLEVVGVDLQPVLGGVPPGLGVVAHPSPRLVGQGADQRRGAGPHRLHHSERGLEGHLVIVERRRPGILVVTLERRRLLGHEEPDPGVGVRLGVRAVANDLVRRPLLRGGAPRERRRRDLGQRRAQAGGAGGVLLDQRLALGAVERHRQRLSSLRRSTFAIPSGAKPSWSSAWPVSKYSRYAEILPRVSSKRLMPRNWIFRPALRGTAPVTT